jgi:hypothetical protein
LRLGHTANAKNTCDLGTSVGCVLEDTVSTSPHLPGIHKSEETDTWGPASPVLCPLAPGRGLSPCHCLLQLESCMSPKAKALKGWSPACSATGRCGTFAWCSLVGGSQVIDTVPCKVLLGPQPLLFFSCFLMAIK